MSATTTLTATETAPPPPSLKAPQGKMTDITQNASYEKFSQPSSAADYDAALAIIRSKLSSMQDVQARFTLSLGTNHPELLIDAKTTPATMEQISDAATGEVDGHLHVRPHTIRRWADGHLEARYSLSWGHILASPSTPARIPVKFIDALGPYPWTHPALKPEMVARLPQPTTDVEKVRSDLAEFGYGLLKDACVGEELEGLRRRLAEQAEGEREKGIATFDGGEGKPNQRVWNLPNKGVEFTDFLDKNPTFERFVPEFLGEDAYLFSYTANIARPGNTPMQLHTDQVTIQPPIRQVPFGLNFMIFLNDVTPELGGTLVMPGSHKGHMAPDDPYNTRDTVSAAGPAGTCLIFESRLWHATGPNVVPNSERPVVIIFFMRAFVRQQENWALSLRDDVAEDLSDKVKGYLGFRSCGSMGGVEGRTKDGTIVGRVKQPVGRLAPAAVAS